MTGNLQLGMVASHDAGRLSRDLERGVAEGAATVGGGSRFKGYVRVPISPQAIVGGSFVMRMVTHLMGVRRTGERVDFGECRIGRRAVHWQYWWPHIGLAWDTHEPEGKDAEIEAKIAWADVRHILYFPPGSDVDVVREAALQRWGTDA